MRRIAAILLTAAAASTAALAVAQTQPTPTASRGQLVEGVVALVNDQVISQSDVRNRMRLILLSFPGQPDQDVLREAQMQATETLIEEKVKMQEFKKMLKDEKVDAADIDERIAGLARQNNIPPERFIADLQAQGVSIQSLRDQMEANTAWEILVGARYGRQIRVSEQRIDQMLERMEESATKPQFRLAEIFLYAPDAASRANAMTRAQTLIQQIQQGADFSQVAQQFSAAPSASGGGDLGWMPEAEMKPEVRAAVLKTTPPSMAPPIETEGGVYLVAVLGKREPADLSSATLNLKQIVAQGDGAGEKVEKVKAASKTCADAITEAGKVEGVNVVDMNGVVLSQVSDAYRSALQNLDVDQSTPVMDGPNAKMALIVCSREAGGGLPTRKQIRDSLFGAEIDMLSDRYLRDAKREATIIRR